MLLRVSWIGGMDMRTPELKPCPFCGGEAHLERNQRAFIGGQTTRVAFVRCTACEARSGRFELRDYGCSNESAEARSAAVLAWNRRAADGNA